MEVAEETETKESVDSFWPDLAGIHAIVFTVVCVFTIFGKMPYIFGATWVINSAAISFLVPLLDPPGSWSTKESLVHAGKVVLASVFGVACSLLARAVVLLLNAP